MELGKDGVKEAQGGLGNHGAVAMFHFLCYLMEVSITRGHVRIMRHVTIGELRQFDSIVIEVGDHCIATLIIYAA